MAGRKSKLNEAMIQKLVELVQVGNYVDVACAAVGITEASYYGWLRIARAIEERIDALPEDADDAEVQALMDSLTDHERNCLAFLAAMRKANAEAEAYAVTIVRKHMPDAWQAAMTFLERRYPGRWKRRDETTVKSPFDPAPQGATIDEQAVLDDPDAVRLLHQALTAAMRGDEPPPVDAHVVEELPESTGDTES